MNENGRPRQDIDVVLWAENRRRIPHEALEPFAGQHVAFNREGTHVVASGPDLETVFAELNRIGLTVSDVGFDYIPGPDEHTWL